MPPIKMITEQNSRPLNALRMFLLPVVWVPRHDLLGTIDLF